jgi:hypothetical protein
MMSQELLNSVASHLAGRPVRVRIQPPVQDFANGAAYKTENGEAIIDVDPGSNNILNTLLHEIAHIRYDFNTTMTPSNFWRAEPGSYKMDSDDRKLLLSMPREDMANQQAAVREKYATENFWKYSGDVVLEKQCKALLDTVDPYSRGKNPELEAWKAKQIKLADEFVRKYKKGKGIK